MAKFFALIGTLTIMAFISAGQASEVDSFHKRYTPIKDSKNAINAKTNELLKEALVNANEQDAGCDEKNLYKSLRKNFRNHYFGKLNPWILESDKVEKIVVGVEDSIYRDFKWHQALIPGFVAKISDPSGKLLKMGPYMVGTDKFEHFLGSGFLYFRKHYLKGNPLEDSLMIGWRSETGYMGAMTTGVMSYADMLANFNGMRFWNHVLSKNEDILGEQKSFNPGPYVSCQDNKWVKVNDVDWLNYIDNGWDEGINCSKFRTNKMAESVKDRIRRLELEEGRSYSCPIYPEKLAEVILKYQDHLKWLVNPNGHESMESAQ